MVDHPELWSSPFTQVEMRRLWTYSDGALTAKGYRLPSGTARAGSWVLVDQATGNVQGVVPPGEFSRRFRPVDLFADVPGLRTYLGTVTASDGTALVDLVLDRNPFMLANGPRRVARPHALIVPRSHRDGWSSATADELAACHTAMTLVAAWYRSMDGGHVVFGANDSAPNLDYLRDMEVAGGTLADGGTDVAVTKNPRQEVQHAHLHAFYAERDGTENHESSALEGYPVIGAGHRAFSTALGNDAVKVQPDSTRLAADVSAAAQPWGGSYCSYQLGVDGPFWVTPALGPSMDEFNRRLARADGLKAEPDPKLGGAINLVRPSLADAERLHAAQRATAEQRASFETFTAQHALNPRSLDVSLEVPPVFRTADPLGSSAERTGENVEGIPEILTGIREEVVKMVIDTSRAITDVAREYGVHETTLGNWVREYKEKNGEAARPRSIFPSAPGSASLSGRTASLR